MIGIIILLIIIIILIIIACTVKSKDAALFFIVIIVFLSICFGAAITDYGNINNPKAIDVYRGNTTLEITEIVKDSIVISKDTVVIFKTK